MAGIYGAGIYGNGDYSASTQISLDAVLAVPLSFTATMGRERPVEATLDLTAFTFIADLDTIMSLETTLEFSLDFFSDLRVAHQYTLEATLDVNPQVFYAKVVADYVINATLNVIPEILPDPYIGPFWVPDGAGGSWTPEPGQTDIWVPETIPPNPWG